MTELTMPPRRLDAAGNPRLLNMALVTRGNTPPRRFRPYNIISKSEKTFMGIVDLQHDCAAMAELAYR